MSDKMRKFKVKPGHVYRDAEREYSAGEEVLIADSVVMTEGYSAGQLREVVGDAKEGKKPESFAPPADEKEEKSKAKKQKKSKKAKKDEEKQEESKEESEA